MGCGMATHSNRHHPCMPCGSARTLDGLGDDHAAVQAVEVGKEALEVGSLHPEVRLGRHGVGELQHRLLQLQALQGTKGGQQVCVGMDRVEVERWT